MVDQSKTYFHNDVVRWIEAPKDLLELSGKLDWGDSIVAAALG